MGKKHKGGKRSRSKNKEEFGSAPGRYAAPLVQWARQPVIADALAAGLLAGAAALTDDKGPRGIAKAAGLGAGNAAVTSARGGRRLGLALAVAAGEVAVRLFLTYAHRRARARLHGARRISAKTKHTAP